MAIVPSLLDVATALPWRLLTSGRDLCWGPALICRAVAVWPERAPAAMLLSLAVEAQPNCLRLSGGELILAHPTILGV